MAAPVQPLCFTLLFQKQTGDFTKITSFYYTVYGSYTYQDYCTAPEEISCFANQFDFCFIKGEPAAEELLSAPAFLSFIIQTIYNLLSAAAQSVVIPLPALQPSCLSHLDSCPPCSPALWMSTRCSCHLLTLTQLPSTLLAAHSKL